MGGFTKGLGYTSAFVAELWGAYEGLKLAKSRGFGQVELELDSTSVVRCLTEVPQEAFKGGALSTHCEAAAV